MNRLVEFLFLSMGKFHVRDYQFPEHKYIPFFNNDQNQILFQRFSPSKVYIFFELCTFG